MKIFITADHHFHHKNIIEYCKRPFKTVEEMDNVMTEKWNRKVGKDDDAKVVYELKGKKQGRFLGIFKIMAKVSVQVDAETEDVKVIKPWWVFLASGI